MSNDASPLDATSGFDVLDSARLSSFHRRVTLLSAAGMFLDGYDITVIAVALPVLTKKWHMSGLLTGWVSAAAIIGMFVGALVFGRLTDRMGRKRMYLVNLIGFVVFAVLAALAQGPWELLACRFLLGLALGADYTIATSLLAEYAPARQAAA